ncbi:ATP:cob(I)alamin adenosyltransferase [Candidatus Shapirobacteria bacterium]|nr:ATP:cob(I)alamin adenosyltransferase [Candidatus Shapirobacteria bacterium]
MSVVTKTGDDGKSRFLGKVMAKDSELLETVGTLDELQALLMIVGQKDLARDIYEIMGELGYEVRSMKYDLRIEQFEKEIKKIEKKLKPITNFLIFKNKNAKKINWVRTVCRRAERRLVALSKKEDVSPKLLAYINRLSDYLFMLSRKEEG